MPSPSSSVAAAESGYGGEGNCRLIGEADMDTRVEHDRFRPGRCPRHESDPSRHGNFYHNIGEDYHVCPTVWYTTRVGTSRVKTAGGFRRFGKDKATMNSAFFAIAFDMKKMCSKT